MCERSWLRLQPVLTFLFAIAAICPSARAHVGSPDVYVEARAGAYPLFITVRPPAVLPGVADVFVRAEGAGVTEISAAPTPLTGDAAAHAPTPDVLRRETDGTYSGSLWIMATGSWQVRLHVRGTDGEGDVAVPLPSTSTAVRTMPLWLGAALGSVGLLLLVGMAGMAAAGVRDAVLPPGTQPDVTGRARGRRAAVLTLVLLASVVIFGNRWWNVEAAAYGRSVYKPLQMSTAIDGNGMLTLRLKDPGWLLQRKLDDLVPDHGHLVHLYAVRWPAMDAVYHLHPERTGTGVFTLAAPAVMPGTYRLFADIVHATGFPETAVTDVLLDGRAAGPLHSDDAGRSGFASAGDADVHATAMRMPDGYSLHFDRPRRVVAQQGLMLRFRLEDANSRPPADMTRYMGMLGHAAVLKNDGSVFAHIHPEGSMAMAAYMMANPEMTMDAPDAQAATVQAKIGTLAIRSGVPGEVSFPYGFPSAGRYRIVVQMKHAETVETGAFDVDVQ